LEDSECDRQARDDGCHPLYGDRRTAFQFWWANPAEMLVPWVDSDLRPRDRMDSRLRVIGHLKPGVTVPQAGADWTSSSGEFRAVVRMQGWARPLVPVQQALSENVRGGLLLLLVAVGLVC